MALQRFNTVRETVLFLLLVSILIGQIDTWANFFALPVFLLQFCSTLLLISLYIIYEENTPGQRRRSSGKNSLLLVLCALPVWYYQQVYIAKSAGKNTDGCARDLLLITTLIPTLIVVLSIVSSATSLIFLR